MKIKLYKRPEKVGWLGWLEGQNGRCIGFIKLNGEIQFGW